MKFYLFAFCFAFTIGKAQNFNYTASFDSPIQCNKIIGTKVLLQTIKRQISSPLNGQNPELSFLRTVPKRGYKYTFTPISN